MKYFGRVHAKNLVGVVLLLFKWHINYLYDADSLKFLSYVIITRMLMRYSQINASCVGKIYLFGFFRKIEPLLDKKSKVFNM